MQTNLNSLVSSIIIAVSISCNAQAKQQIDSEQATIADEIAAIFESQNVEATLVVVSSDGKTQHTYNPVRAKTRFSPASTFKIVNTLIALEAGMVNSTASAFQWDGKNRGIASWNNDQTLSSAFQVSCVWCYQEIAREVGAEQYHSTLKKLGYGNQQVGEQVDLFWLNGTLQISAIEQVELLSQISNYSIEFERKNLEILRTIMRNKETRDYALYEKTGWATTKPGIGWYVGFIEKGDDRWHFAMNMRVDNAQQAKLRKPLTIQALQKLGVIE